MNAAAFQSFAQDGLLERKLRLVACVLIVAAAAYAEVRTGRRYAFGRDDDDLLGFGDGVTALFIVLSNVHAGLLARQGERHKDSFASKAGKKRAAINGLGYLHELELHAFGLSELRLVWPAPRGLGLLRLHCWLI